MDQVKHIVAACLILFSLTVVYAVGRRVFSLQWIADKEEPTFFCGTVNSVENVVLTTAQLKGEQIFKQNCASCHALDKNLSGPALRGVEGRGPWGDRKNLYAWVKNPAAFIPTTPYTQDLQKTYGSIMPGFPALLKEDVDAIVDYISAY